MKKQHHAYTLRVDDQYHRLDINITLSHTFLENEKKGCFEDPLKDEFCMEEDKFLLMLDNKGRIQNDDDRRATPVELLNEYKEEQKKDAVHFNKADIEAQVLRDRLNTLRNMGLRFQILSDKINEELEKIVRTFFSNSTTCNL